MKKMCKIASGLLFVSVMVSNAYAGGIALGTTRVIYPQGDKQVSLPVINSSTNNAFLVQSWVANADQSKSSDFILTPPLFVMHPKKENTIRIMYVGPDLPTDRESVFYLNSKAIPAVDKNNLRGNTLQIATQSVIKLFIRPKKLPTPSIDAPKTLRCRVANGKVTITNPSPYYVSLVKFNVGTTLLKNNMVSPKNTLTVDVPGEQAGQVSFQTVNDFGATTPVQSCPSA
ncbi:fimbria/pilus periplasmic chaperone [Enterobacter cloacae complex sp. ECC445]|uniref:fimbria/pilus periplasmic chaperone n=1 Tax=Enterobacter cloacae complex sp. ECC445 TaxID=2913213 RepID=UPI001F00E2D1|nr:fimbria/pilus periplasmic chaperone [Enterobacter cloacae complex sp. ECC445]MCG0456008.1 fimbria/pilus periplasmic chaperone [Enterobacter cloacae complex sp. ECC445]